ncbi:MAG TPA: FkbM family methyltransferase [Xanthobacteraceae bacterium]
MPSISYAQRFEDLYLMRCFGDRTDGFYIDIGSGHPVYDNVSFAFYLKGWDGITVEPNPWLSRLSRAVRPRDHHVEALVGSRSGEATFYQVREFHGLSTMIETHAQAALAQFGKGSDAIAVPLVTLAELCAGQAPAVFDFLKVDVEGAEADVLEGGDWRRYRPKLVVIEALAPYTLAPAFAQWEPLLARHGYSYVWFDSLNRYYVAREAAELAECFTRAPASFDDAIQFRDTRPALVDQNHPDHGLATLLGRAFMTRLPVLDRALLVELLTAGLPAVELDRRADEADLARIWERLFGPHVSPKIGDLRLPPDVTIRSLYAAIAESDPFRAACGRISASYGW